MAPVTLVPDASVVLKWFLREEDSPKALYLRDLSLQGEVAFVVPSLLFYEVTNILRRHKELRAEQVDLHIEALFAAGFEEVPPTVETIRAAHREARATGATVYDASYLALAKHRKAVMVTADAKFDRQARSRHVATLGRVYREFHG